MASFKEFLGETVEKHSAAPMTVLLKRVGVRQFNGNESVALYTNDQLGLKVTVPLDTMTGKLRPTNTYAAHESVEVEVDPNLVIEDGMCRPGRNQRTLKDFADWHEGVSKKGNDIKFKLHNNGNTTSAFRASKHIGSFHHDKRSGFIQEDLDNITEAPIHSINTIMRTGEERDVAFRNGASAKVHPVTAKAIHDLWHKVNSTNKAKLSELINSSPEGLVRVAKFADSLTGAKK